MVGSLVDLLDLRTQFQKVSLRIFKVGEQHVPRAVAARSAHTLEPSIAQMNNGLRQLRASREIERCMLHASLRQRDKAERVGVELRLADQVANPDSRVREPLEPYFVGLIIAE